MVPQTQQINTANIKAHHTTQFSASTFTTSLFVIPFLHFIFSSIQRNNVLSRQFELIHSNSMSRKSHYIVLGNEHSYNSTNRTWNFGSVTYESHSLYVIPPTCKVTLITQTTSKLHNIVDLVIIGFHGCQEGLMPLYQVFCLFQVDL